ncbi:hypothetical protein ACOMHN_037339 [Nucella lapillus]
MGGDTKPLVQSREQKPTDGRRHKAPGAVQGTKTYRWEETQSPWCSPGNKNLQMGGDTKPLVQSREQKPTDGRRHKAPGAVQGTKTYRWEETQSPWCSPGNKNLQMGGDTKPLVQSREQKPTDGRRHKAPGAVQGTKTYRWEETQSPWCSPGNKNLQMGGDTKPLVQSREQKPTDGRRHKAPGAVQGTKTYRWEETQSPWCSPGNKNLQMGGDTKPLVQSREQKPTDGRRHKAPGAVQGTKTYRWEETQSPWCSPGNKNLQMGGDTKPLVQSREQKPTDGRRHKAPGAVQGTKTYRWEETQSPWCSPGNKNLQMGGDTKPLVQSREQKPTDGRRHKAPGAVQGTKTYRWEETQSPWCSPGNKNLQMGGDTKPLVQSREQKPTDGRRHKAPGAVQGTKTYRWEETQSPWCSPGNKNLQMGGDTKPLVQSREQKPTDGRRHKAPGAVQGTKTYRWEETQSPWCSPGNKNLQMGGDTKPLVQSREQKPTDGRRHKAPGAVQGTKTYRWEETQSPWCSPGNKNLQMGGDTKPLVQSREQKPTDGRRHKAPGAVQGTKTYRWEETQSPWCSPGNKNLQMGGDTKPLVQSREQKPTDGRRHKAPGAVQGTKTYRWEETQSPWCSPGNKNLQMGGDTKPLVQSREQKPTDGRRHKAPGAVQGTKTYRWEETQSPWCSPGNKNLQMGGDTKPLVQSREQKPTDGRRHKAPGAVQGTKTYRWEETQSPWCSPGNKNLQMGGDTKPLVQSREQKPTDGRRHKAPGAVQGTKTYRWEETQSPWCSPGNKNLQMGGDTKPLVQSREQKPTDGRRHKAPGAVQGTKTYRWEETQSPWCSPGNKNLQMGGDTKPLVQSREQKPTDGRRHKAPGAVQGTKTYRWEETQSPWCSPGNKNLQMGGDTKPLVQSREQKPTDGRRHKAPGAVQGTKTYRWEETQSPWCSPGNKNLQMGGDTKPLVQSREQKPTDGRRHKAPGAVQGTKTYRWEETQSPWCSPGNKNLQMGGDTKPLVQSREQKPTDGRRHKAPGAVQGTKTYRWEETQSPWCSPGNKNLQMGGDTKPLVQSREQKPTDGRRHKAPGAVQGTKTYRWEETQSPWCSPGNKNLQMGGDTKPLVQSREQKPTDGRRHKAPGAVQGTKTYRWEETQSPWCSPGNKNLQMGGDTKPLVQSREQKPTDGRRHKAPGAVQGTKTYRWEETQSPWCSPGNKNLQMGGDTKPLVQSREQKPTDGRRHKAPGAVQGTKTYRWEETQSPWCSPGNKNLQMGGDTKPLVQSREQKPTDGRRHKAPGAVQGTKTYRWEETQSPWCSPGNKNLQMGGDTKPLVQSREQKPTDGRRHKAPGAVQGTKTYRWEETQSPWCSPGNKNLQMGGDTKPLVQSREQKPTDGRRHKAPGAVQGTKTYRWEETQSPWCSPGNKNLQMGGDTKPLVQSREQKPTDGRRHKAPGAVQGTKTYRWEETQSPWCSPGNKNLQMGGDTKPLVQSREQKPTDGRS